MFTKEKRKNYFLSQVHQPFFILGVINAIIMMLLFGLSYKGIINLQIDITLFHTYTLIYSVFLNIFTGFLFTTYPRFCGQGPIDKEYYIKVFYLSTLSSIGLIIGAIYSFIILITSMLFLLYSNYLILIKLIHIFNNSDTSSHEDPFWILLSFKLGFIGNFLFLISAFYQPILAFSIIYSFFMFLIFLTFSIAQRMIPFFSHSLAEKDHRFVSTVFVLFILKTLLTTFNYIPYVKIAEIFIDVILGLYLLGEFLAWNIIDKNANAILWVLHLGLFWLPISFFIDSISLAMELIFDTNFVFLGLHIVSIGFLTTIFIGFGTRVTYGHAGLVPQANQYEKLLFLFIQFVLLTRLIYSLNIGLGFNQNYFFDISLASWIIIFILWGAKFFPILINNNEK